ncbi:phasin family protein [Variovorax paradoxus]|uniref:Poly(Hydroxyalkanoate) granule associated protein (Phasin) PhaI n=1 Tax=Variovorax paradoxus TaxID=34073 RepID=A0A0H2M2Q4_VARPD|nr:phasin family protein [Variovorax paradoxus]KLN54997.1 poly(hydroxyalkanoate) granule associated protein (phasin) PhaI [Variovorax paradoxus]
MATRLDPTDDSKKKRAAPAKPARKTPAARKAPAAGKRAAAATKKPAAAAPDAGPGKKAVGAEGLLRAGLKVLGNVRDDVAKRQANVIEGLLGIGQGKFDPAGAKAAVPRGFPSLDSFGLRKFEDVFDQRVATALQRLGMPSAEEVQALREEVIRLRERLAQLDPKNAGLRGSGKR